jgi:hypothetical protein
VPECILCGDVSSAALCWRGVNLCVLWFCIGIIYDGDLTVRR